MQTPLSLFRYMCAAAVISSTMNSIARSDDNKGIATAPPGTEAVGTTFEGTFYVSRVLKKQFDRLLSQVATLEERVRSGELKPAEARKELNDLRSDLKDVKQLIDDQKVLVSAFKIHRQEEKGTFELGPERLLVLTSDKVRIIGWDQPHVKYVLERIVLSAGAAVDADLAGIVVKHEHKIVPNLVGNTLRHDGPVTHLDKIDV